jgi:cell wall-associated NlpC family hydrolase
MRKLFLIIMAILVCGAYFSKREIFHGTYRAPRTAKQAIAYARKQLGKPYLWGGEGPWVFDCSGLTYKAYGLPAGQRTSQQQWSAQRHVKHPQAGDLVYFRGVLLGKEAPPGHVGIVIGKNKMIDGYGRGTVMRVESFGEATSAPGLQSVMGFTRP